MEHLLSYLYLREIRYSKNPEDWFLRLQSLGHPQWLDSNESPRGRFDILTAEPVQWFVLPAGSEPDAATRYFAELRDACHHCMGNAALDLPFSGGLIGLLSYDFGRTLEQLPPHDQAESALPLGETGLYDWALVFDQQQRRGWFVCRRPPAAADALLSRLLALPTTRPAPFIVQGPLQQDLTQAEYNRCFNRIQDYILAGDCYQINFAQRYHADYKGDPAHLYLALRQSSSAPYAAWFSGESSTSLCLSPERFVKVTGKQVVTQPIKGTISRATNTATDRRNAKQLLASEKDRAENLMIVDLLRNDFGKVCRPGSIQVPTLFELQSFAVVHHLVSTITGELNDDCDALDLLQAVSPGGSITGAPKHRAMQIIDELEPNSRGAYCGSIFYYSVDGKLDSNILIRTLQCARQQVTCWGGGGVVLDSTAELEWQEIGAKIGHLLEALNNCAEAPPDVDPLT